MKQIFLFILMAAALVMGFAACGDDEEGNNNPGAINQRNFPDAKFREWLMSQEFGKDGVLTDEEIAKVTSIDVSNMGIKSLVGIENFRALAVLDCQENQLMGLNLSNNPNLIILRCWKNQLYSLDVYKNLGAPNTGSG